MLSYFALKLSFSDRKNKELSEHQLHQTFHPQWAISLIMKSTQPDTTSGIKNRIEVKRERDIICIERDIWMDPAH